MRTAITALALVLWLAGCASTEEAEEPEDPFALYGFEEDDGELCIPLRRIKSTKILSDRVIVFEMHGGENFINILPNRCPGLRPNRPIMYETRQNQLCNVDIIRLLDQGGFDMRPIGACGLGRFHTVPQGMPIVVGDEEDDEDE